MIRHSLIAIGLILMGGLLAGCFHENPAPGNDGNQSPTEDVLEVSVAAPDQAKPNQPFTVSVTVSTSQSVPAISLRADFDGLSLVDRGDFMNVEGNVAQAAIVQPAAGDEQTFEFQVECEDPAEYAMTAIVQSKDVKPVWNTVRVPCSE